MNICVAGQGELAETLVYLAERAGNNAVLLPTEVEGAPLAVAHSDLVLLATSPELLRPLVRALRPGPGSVVVVAGRGLDPESGRRLSEIVPLESACLRVGALGGPLLPAELRQGSPGACVVASAFEEVNQRTVKALHSPLFRVYPSRDLADVELAGALVLVLSAALGVARGMGLGVGTQAVLVTRGIAEGARLARRTGGDPSTFSGLAGVGELVAASSLPDHPGQSRGRALASGGQDLPLAALCDALLSRERDLPITAGIRLLAQGKISAAQLLHGLTERQGRAESQ